MSETTTTNPGDRSIPVIDFSCYSIDIPDAEADKLLLSSESKVKTLADQLTRALEDHRGAIIVNHGINMSTIKSVRDEGMLFFGSSKEYKHQFVTDFLHGYIPPGVERCELVDKPMSPAIEGFVAQIGPAFKDFPWPDDKFPGIRNAFTQWQKVTNRLGGRIVDLLSLGLGFKDPLYMRSIHCDLERNAHCYRLNYYPAQPKDKECQVGIERFGEHKDYDTVTMLATTGPGLQSRQKDGVWVDVPVIEDGIFIHGGIALQEYSSDKIMPDYHRVVMPSPPVCFKERLTLICFFCPYTDAPIASLDGSGKYQPHRAGEIGRDAYDTIFRPKNK